jgi:hypothetical protein
MKKGLVLALGSVLMFNAHAESYYCDYKDYFHLSAKSHPEIYVVSGYSDQDLILQFVGPRSFIIRGGLQCSNGYAHVTVAYDAAHWCVLDIKDGPYMNHPSISASCKDMGYLGIDYDGVGSYSYSINLD